MTPLFRGLLLSKASSTPGTKTSIRCRPTRETALCPRVVTARYRKGHPSPPHRETTRCQRTFMSAMLSMFSWLFVRFWNSSTSVRMLAPISPKFLYMLARKNSSCSLESTTSFKSFEACRSENRVEYRSGDRQMRNKRAKISNSK